MDEITKESTDKDSQELDKELESMEEIKGIDNQKSIPEEKETPENNGQVSLEITPDETKSNGATVKYPEANSDDPRPAGAEVEQPSQKELQSPLKDQTKTNISGEIRTKIQGTTFQAGAQDTLRSLKPGQTLNLVPEPENPVDKFAIKIVTQDNIHLGYVGKNLCHQYHESLKKGTRYIAKIIDITGGTDEKDRLGCNILIKQFNLDEEIMEAPIKIYELENKLAAMKFRLEELKLAKDNIASKTEFEISIEKDEDDKKKYTNAESRSFATKQKLGSEAGYLNACKLFDQMTKDIKLHENKLNFEVNMFKATRAVKLSQEFRDNQ